MKGVSALVVVILLTACAPGRGAGAGPVVDPDGLVVYGEADYGWPLRTVAGEPLSLERYRGEVVFLNLWASWCAPCVAEMRGIEGLRRSMAAEDVEFLLVSPEAPEPVAAFLARYGYDLPVALEAAEMPASFGLRGLPTTYVLDREGRIVLRHQGAADWDQESIRAFLRRLAEEGR